MTGLIDMIPRKARERARKEEASPRTAKESKCTTRHRMAGRFAGSGTIRRRGADFNVGAFMSANYASEVIPCMHVTVQARRIRLVRQPRLPSRIEAAQRGRQPHLLRWQRAPRGAHESVRFCTCSAEHNERPPSLPSFVIWRRTHASHLRYKRSIFRIHQLVWPRDRGGRPVLSSHHGPSHGFAAFDLC